MFKHVTGNRAALSFLAGAALTTALGFAVGFTAGQDHPRQDHPRQAAEDMVRVATYEPQTAFSQYHRAEAFNQQAAQLQQEMAQAQQEGDQQRMQEIQTQLQQARQEVVEAFYEDIESAAPKVAEGAGIQVVAVDVLYTASDIDEPRDITGQLIRQVNREANATEGAPRNRERPASRPNSSNRP